MQPIWRSILTDTAGTELGELWQARGRTVDKTLNGLPTITGSTDLDNPMVDLILGATPLERLDLLVKSYRNGELMFNGPFTAGEESGEESGAGSFSFVAGGPLWRLGSRMVGKTTAGYSDGTPLATKDLGQIASGMILVTNLEGDTGIRVGTIEPSSNSFVEKLHFKKIAEAIAELGPGLLGGFDFEIVPEEPFTEGGQVVIGTFNAYGALGSFKPNVVFEYGTGLRNVASYRRPITRESEANRIYGIPPGWPDGVDAAASLAVANEDASRGLFEDAIAPDVGSNFLRQKAAEEHARIRHVPREQVLFTPVANAVPDYGEYDVGDLVTARAVVNGRPRFDAVFRIYGIKFTIGDDGTEQIELKLVNEE